MHVVSDGQKESTRPLYVASNVDLIRISCFYHQLT